ncbi:hypothetical protein CsSME_00013302 [Camellia sinensis var. sinensis]
MIARRWNSLLPKFPKSQGTKGQILLGCGKLTRSWAAKSSSRPGLSVPTVHQAEEASTEVEGHVFFHINASLGLAGWLQVTDWPAVLNIAVVKGAMAMLLCCND